MNRNQLGIPFHKDDMVSFAFTLTNGELEVVVSPVVHPDPLANLVTTIKERIPSIVRLSNGTHVFKIDSEHNVYYLAPNNRKAQLVDQTFFEGVSDAMRDSLPHILSLSHKLRMDAEQLSAEFFPSDEQMKSRLHNLVQIAAFEALKITRIGGPKRVLLSQTQIEVVCSDCHQDEVFFKDQDYVLVPILQLAGASHHNIFFFAANELICDQAHKVFGNNKREIFADIASGLSVLADAVVDTLAQATSLSGMTPAQIRQRGEKFIDEVQEQLARRAQLEEAIEAFYSDLQTRVGNLDDMTTNELNEVADAYAEELLTVVKNALSPMPFEEEEY